MSQENVELIERAIVAVNARDIDAYLACCTEDVELHTPLTEVADEVEDLIDAGDQVVSVQTSHARGRASGVAVDLAHFAAVWTIRQGKIVRVALFTTRADALAAVGLRE
jgi:ketosteroid isomerase-like protein